MATLIENLYTKRQEIIGQLAAIDLLIGNELKLLSISNQVESKVEETLITDSSKDDYPYYSSWGEKIIFLLNESGNIGLYAKEIIEKLQQRENQNPLRNNKPVSEKGINTTLQNMKDKQLRVESVFGRNKHFVKN